MKIIISGTHSIGKSTLLANLKSEAPLFTFLPELSRELMEKELIKSVGITCSHKDQMLMFEQHYKNILQYDTFISDRGALDAFVYATQNYLDGAYTYEEHLEHEEIFLRCIKQYNKVIYIPLATQPFSKDEIRNDDLKFRKNIDLMFRKTISMYNINNVYKVDINDLGEKELLEQTIKILTD